MTIAVAVQVHDGVVLASDSATTLSDPAKTGPESILNVFNNANKIFNLRKGLPIGGMTYGMGSVGSSSISTLAKDLRKRFSGYDEAHKDWELDSSAFTVEGVAQRAREFLYEENFVPLGIKPSPGVHLGFIVAGYSAAAQLSEVWLVEIKDGNCDPPRLLLGQGIPAAYAAGDPEVFSRLVLGYSQSLKDVLAKLGLNDNVIPEAFKIIQKELFVSLVEAPMPIIDTIDLAEFLVYATTMFTKFKHGAATVGGPTESAAITKHEGFKWVRRKHYFDAALNPTGDR